MCFSATASFSASVVLAAVGVASIKEVKANRHFMFAAVPFIFAIQQFAEGIVWLSFDSAYWSHWQNSASYSFLFFAEVLWPAWVPLAMLTAEEHPTRKWILKIVASAGAILSIYLTYCLFSYRVVPENRGHHVFYNLDFPPIVSTWGAATYFVAVVFSPLLSGVKNMKWFGLTIFLSYIAATLFLVETRISAWCFFAAVSSICVLFILKSLRQPAVLQSS